MKKKHLQPLTPAALYARVSSDRQDVDLSGRMGMLRASTASLGTNSWTGSSSIPSGRCRSSPSSGATSTTTNAPTAPWAIALLLQRPSSPPLLQALSVSHDLWYNYWGQVTSDRQDVDLSVSAQLRALKDYARANDYSVAEWQTGPSSGR